MGLIFVLPLNRSPGCKCTGAFVYSVFSKNFSAGRVLTPAAGRLRITVKPMQNTRRSAGRRSSFSGVPFSRSVQNS